MKNLKLLMITLLGLSLGLSSCKKDDDDPIEQFGDLTISLNHQVDGVDVVFNEFDYTNAASYSYSITHIEYYISEILLTSVDGSTYQDDGAYYVNIEDPTTLDITLPDVPYGTYAKIEFKLGLDDSYNFAGGLANTIENNNMAWPEPMGGGYHFMKFEGNYQPATGGPQGFAMHLGKDGNYSECANQEQFQVQAQTQTRNLTMNMNEWFRNPYVFDFETDGTHIMMNDSSLVKLSANGDDVFSGTI